MQSILLLISPHESVIYKTFYTAVYGAFYRYFKEHSIGFLWDFLWGTQTVS